MEKTISNSKTLSSRLAFTMAEILISLTIIGVIAAITLPALRANINENTLNTKRKALYTRMSQAIGMMGTVGGYGVSTEVTDMNQNAAMTFVTEGLDKVLKINNICDKDNLSKCGLPDKITKLPSGKIDFPKKFSEVSNNIEFINNINTDAVAFETVNGESVAVFYNPLCGDKPLDYTYSTHRIICANFLYDLNGKKGPNIIGNDIGFITVLSSTEPSVVAPIPLSTFANDGNAIKQTLAAAACTTQDENSRLPNIDELTSLYTNKGLLSLSNNYFWSSSVVPPNKAYYMDFTLGSTTADSLDKEYRVWCVKR